MKKTGQILLQILKVISLYLLCYLLSSVSAFAQSKGNAQNKKLTVGELLKRAQDESRGGKDKGLTQLNKSNTQLPTTSLQFQAQQKQNLDTQSEIIFSNKH